MLIYAHLNRHPLPTTNLQTLQETILPIYPFLADRLISFLVATKYGGAIKSTILLIQAIKQATMPNSLPSTDLPCKTSIPKLYIWNNNFRVSGERQVYTDSKVWFWCHAYLHDSNIKFSPIAVEMLNSDDEEGDVEVILARKKRKNDGDIQILPPANTPYFPDVSHFIFAKTNEIVS